MGRTNWKFSKKHINVLTIGINIGLGYTLRIRESTIVGNRLAHEYKRKPEDRVEVWSMPLYLGGKVEEGKEAMELYQRRWGESCYLAT